MYNVTTCNTIYFCLLYVILTVCINFLLLCRYCRKAKAVFKELKQKPYVVELDERGITFIAPNLTAEFPFSILTCCLTGLQLPTFQFYQLFTRISVVNKNCKIHQLTSHSACHQPITFFYYFFTWDRNIFSQLDLSVKKKKTLSYISYLHVIVLFFFFCLL